ncbi:hypothetical protein [Streptomyces sp. NPDC017993]|uniref:hypothetical protein n=1 Tax=Streptomyces sp. NPDC017993 TaxID=3365027 RepID=UPI00378BA242
MITQARAGMHTAQESRYNNPRRLLRRHRERTRFENYGAVLGRLERTLYQAAALTRSLDQWRASETTYPYRAFLESYATFLEVIADIAQLPLMEEFQHTSDVLRRYTSS